MAFLDPKVKENLKDIKRIIGVYSGKGGVGKTTLAINIAACLARKGYRVSLLDADIDCPNVARALGIKEELHLDALDKRIIPHEKYGMKIVSMASLQKSDDEAIVWRGPMLTDMLMKFFGNTVWGSLDYMIVDLPPGTSDIPLTVMKFIRPHGMVIVTTPRSISEVDARKSINLAKMTNIKVLGVVENMSGGVFGSGRGKECADFTKVSFLGRVDFDEIYMNSVDSGYPAVLKSKNADEQVSNIIDMMQKSEKEILGESLASPKKGLINSVKNLGLDFKAEMIDRYKNI